jgi:hypothetical protein
MVLKEGAEGLCRMPDVMKLVNTVLHWSWEQGRKGMRRCKDRGTAAAMPRMALGDPSPICNKQGHRLVNSESTASKLLNLATASPHRDVIKNQGMSCSQHTSIIIPFSAAHPSYYFSL